MLELVMRYVQEYIHILHGLRYACSLILQLLVKLQSSYI